jgi:hypothetical protein
LIILILLGKEYKLWSSSYSPQHPVLKHPQPMFLP